MVGPGGDRFDSGSMKRGTDTEGVGQLEPDSRGISEIGKGGTDEAESQFKGEDVESHTFWPRQN